MEKNTCHPNPKVVLSVVYQCSHQEGVCSALCVAIAPAKGKEES